jgi:hypothetical protein
MKLNTEQCPYPDTCQITAGRSIRQPGQYEHLYIEDVVAAIKFGMYQELDLGKLISRIRAEANPDRAKNRKQALPFFTGSYYEESRANANVRFACFAIIDLDHVADITGTKKLIMERFPYAVCAFRSVNDGVKIVVSLRPAICDDAHFRAIYAILMQKIEDITRIKPDSTPDWARACFFSHDPDLLFNEDYLGFSCELPSAPVSISCPPAAPLFPLPPTEDDFAKAELVIKALAAGKISYQDWIKTGLALKAAFGERGKALWLLFADNPYYNDDTTKLERKWNSFRGSGAVGIGSIFFIGEKHGIC